MLTSLKKIIARHWLIIVIALLLGLAVYLPKLFWQNNLGTAYQGVTKSFIDDDLYYLTRGREVIDGHANLASPCFSEHKDGWPMQFWLPDYLLAKPLAILSVNVVSGYGFYSFLLALLTVILAYTAIYALVGSRKLAIAGALLLATVLFFPLFWRLPSPGLNHVFWLSLFNLLIQHLKRGKNCCLILAALNLGLLFYIYPYYWTWYFILLALLILVELFWLKNGLWQKHLLMLGGALIIGLGYFWELFKSFSLPEYNDALTRLGLLNTHFPSGLKIIVLAIVLSALLFWLLRKKIVTLNPLLILLLSGTISAGIAVNQHVLTGKNLEFSSHYWLPSAYIFVFTGVYCFQYLLYKYCPLTVRRTVRKAALGLMIIWSALTVFQEVKTAGAALPQDFERQSYAPVFAWLNANAATDAVVYANQDLSVYLPIYTAANVYYNQTCTLFFLSDAEVQSRFAIQRYFDGLSDEKILEAERSIWGTRYINAYAHNQSKNKLRKVIGLKPVEYEKIPPAEIERIKALLAEIKTLDFRTALRGYRADYLLWDKNSDPHWQLDRYDWLEQVYNDGNFGVYKIN